MQWMRNELTRTAREMIFAEAMVGLRLEERAVRSL